MNYQWEQAIQGSFKKQQTSEIFPILKTRISYLNRCMFKTQGTFWQIFSSYGMNLGSQVIQQRIGFQFNILVKKSENEQREAIKESCFDSFCSQKKSVSVFLVSF